MSRVNYPIKLSTLIKEAQKALKQYGDRYVLLSDDEEGNGVFTNVIMLSIMQRNLLTAV